MVLAILLGGIFGLLVAGGVLAVGVVKQGRRDQDDINLWCGLYVCGRIQNYQVTVWTPFHSNPPTGFCVSRASRH